MSTYGGGYDNRLLAYPPPPTSAYPGPSGPSQPSPTSVSFPLTPFIFHPETVCIPTPDPNNENNIPLPCGPTPTATFTPGTTNTPSPTASPTHTPTPLTPVWATPTHNPYNGTPFPTVTGTPGTPFPRQGVAPAMGGRSQAVNNRPNFSSWQYYWSAGVPLPHQHPGLEHVPMIWGVDGYGRWEDPARWQSARNSISQSDARTPDHNYWLIFNECEHQEQCNAPANAAAAFFYNQLLTAFYGADRQPGGDNLGLDEDAQLIIGGVNASPCGIRWLKDFVEAYRLVSGGADVPAAGWHFHIYPGVVPEEWPDPNDPENGCDSLWWGRADRAAAEFAIADMQSTLYGFLWTFGEPEDEIWLTEIGCLNPSTTACGDDTFMFEYVSTVMGWLNGNGRWIDRYAWFSDWDPGTVDCEDPLDPEFDGGKWSWQMLYDLTATPLPPYNPCITPTPTSTPSVPFHTPTPTPIPGMQYSALGVYYSEVIPAPPALKPWPTHFLYLPSIFNE